MGSRVNLLFISRESTLGWSNVRVGAGFGLGLYALKQGGGFKVIVLK